MLGQFPAVVLIHNLVSNLLDTLDVSHSVALLKFFVNVDDVDLVLLLFEYFFLKKIILGS